MNTPAEVNCKIQSREIESHEQKDFLKRHFRTAIVQANMETLFIHLVRTQQLLSDSNGGALKFYEVTSQYGSVPVICHDTDCEKLTVRNFMFDTRAEFPSLLAALTATTLTLETLLRTLQDKGIEFSDALTDYYNNLWYNLTRTGSTLAAEIDLAKEYFDFTD